MASSEPLGANIGSSLLLTDRSQLDMLQAYRDAGMTASVVFEFFVRRLPPTRGSRGRGSRASGRVF
jgi:nicotinate phosphoribosyltransferase